MPLVKPTGEHGDECVCRGSLVDDGLDARAVLGDAKAALPLLVEVGGEVDSASLLVVEEDSSEGRRIKLQTARAWAARLPCKSSRRDQGGLTGFKQKG
jgi:hypothetical protein